MPPRRRRRPLLVLLSTLGLAYVAYGAAHGNQSQSSLRRHAPTPAAAAVTTGLPVKDDDGGQDKKRWDDKVVLLNDLSLEQAYLHHAAAGQLGEQEGFSESLAQQAARLAAGAYDRYDYMCIQSHIDRPTFT